MRIADDELHAMQAAFDEGVKELAPMDFGLAQGDADAEDGAFAIGADAEGDEYGAIHEQAAVTHFFIPGVENEVGVVRQWALTPLLELAIELGGAGAYLAGSDFVAAEFFDDFGDFACGDALDIHFGHGENQRLFAAHAAF